ncbi:MAG: acyltransferase family protein [Panacagrimonas sp.]
MAKTHPLPEQVAPIELIATPASTAPVTQDIPGLNGMRAIAVLLVVLFHAGYSLVPGTFGVTIFFVLSGYLITTLLQREHARTGTLSFSRFYARRALRLLPPLYVVTLLFVGAVHFRLISGEVEPGWILSTLFFYGNYFWLIISPESGMPREIQLVWSLAVEEHFYLIWPPLALLLFRAARPRRSMTLFLLAAMAAVLAWRFIVYQYHGAPALYVSFATETRIDSLLVGCWLAMVKNPLAAAPVNKLQPADIGWLVASALLLVVPPLLPDTDTKLLWVLSTHPVLLAPVFWILVARHRFWPFTMLNHPVLDYIGRISYTLYLVHWGVASVVLQHFGALPPSLRLVLTLAASIAIAELVRRFVEEPLAVVRRRLSMTDTRPAAPEMRG